MELLRFMLLPMIACLFLAGIHGYLGIHVVSRGVIFVDLAMAQVAALGAAVGLIFHYELSSPVAYAFSIAFTLIGAGILSVTHFRDHRVPHEAIIGVVYAVSAAAVILVMDHAPHGSEHIKELLVGHILWVSKKEVIGEAIVYGLVGLVFAFLAPRIHLISMDHEAAMNQGRRIYLWDFLFYALFGIVVTVSVRLAGVLLVFAFLVVPAIIAFMFWNCFKHRIIAAWAVGAAVSIVGCVVSFEADLPTGATVVVTFGVTLIIAGIIYRLFKYKPYQDEVCD